MKPGRCTQSKPAQAAFSNWYKAQVAACINSPSSCKRPAQRGGGRDNTPH
nr:MAG TPA: hypothetical protein [Caudoviricetes sp.]